MVNIIGENDTAVSKPCVLHLATKLEGVDEDHNEMMEPVAKELSEIIRGKASYFAGPVSFGVALWSSHTYISPRDS